MSNIKPSPEYQKGYTDGFKEGYSKALEHLQVNKVFEMATRPVVANLNQKED